MQGKYEIKINSIFKNKLNGLLYIWSQNGLPPVRSILLQQAKDLSDWKKDNNISGLWTKRPLMLTATLDDSWGHGLEVIHEPIPKIDLLLYTAWQGGKNYVRQILWSNRPCMENR